jgi:protein TonB
MTRRSWLVMFSIVAHAGVLVLILVASVMATGAIPTPFDRLTFEYQPVKIADIQLPAAPPAHAPKAEIAPPSNAAPIEAPVDIAPEPPSVTAAAPLPPSIDGVLTGTDIGAALAAPPAPPPPPPAPTPASPVRVGSGVRPPQRVVTVDPAYPAAARAARIEGIIILEATIDVDGRVISIKVLKSVPLLDEAAIAAVREWRYTPTLLNGQPVPVIMTVTVNFALGR